MVRLESASSSEEGRVSLEWWENFVETGEPELGRLLTKETVDAVHWTQEARISRCSRDGAGLHSASEEATLTSWRTMGRRTSFLRCAERSV